MKNHTYVVTCYERVEGDGPICWYGEQEYKFNTYEETQEFINYRLSVLGEQNDDNRLYNEDKTPTEQFVVTYYFKCEME